MDPDRDGRSTKLPEERSDVFRVRRREVLPRRPHCVDSIRRSSHRQQVTIFAIYLVRGIYGVVFNLGPLATQVKFLGGSPLGFTDL